jgi:hypothetical protein
MFKRIAAVIADPRFDGREIAIGRLCAARLRTV